MTLTISIEYHPLVQGVRAFLWLVLVVIVTLVVVALVYWVVRHVVGFVVDSTP